MSTLVHTHVCTHVYTHLSVYMPVHMPVHTPVHMPVHMSVHMSVHVSVYMSVYMYVHMHVRMHVYMYVHTYVHVYVHMYVHMSVHMSVHVSVLHVRTQRTEGLPERGLSTTSQSSEANVQVPVSALYRLYIGIADGPVSASPTACPLSVYGRAGTQKWPPWRELSSILVTAY